MLVSPVLTRSTRRGNRPVPPLRPSPPPASVDGSDTRFIITTIIIIVFSPFAQPGKYPEKIRVSFRIVVVVVYVFREFVDRLSRKRYGETMFCLHGTSIFISQTKKKHPTTSDHRQNTLVVLAAERKQSFGSKERELISVEFVSSLEFVSQTLKNACNVSTTV